MKSFMFSRSHASFLFLTCGLLSIYFLWPGTITDDSISTYKLALTQSYQRELGPLFQMLWFMTDKVVTGSGGMLVVQMGLFWGAAYLYAQTFLKSRWFFWFVGVFFWPSLWVSMGCIWKDLYFVFSYLFVGGYLSLLVYQKRSLGVFSFFWLWVLLIWATSIKYQAQFVLAFPLFWMCSSLRIHSFLKKYALGLGMVVLTLGAIEFIHQTLVPPVQEAHRWQSVKIYDLAGISINAKENVLPSFLFKRPSVTLEDIQTKYSHLWEPLIVDVDSPLRFTQTEAEREQLMTTWRKMVWTHPGAYLAHRARVLYKTLSGNDVKYPVRRFLKDHHLPTWPGNLGVLFSYLLGLPLSIFYVVLALRTRMLWSAAPLLYLNGMALVYTSFLFVFSLASTSRYVYFSVACLAFSHPFAYVCWKRRKTTSLSHS